MPATGFYRSDEGVFTMPAFAKQCTVLLPFPAGRAAVRELEV
jgi:hypothetical protein